MTSMEERAQFPGDKFRFAPARHWHSLALRKGCHFPHQRSFAASSSSLYIVAQWMEEIDALSPAIYCRSTTGQQRLRKYRQAFPMQGEESHKSHKYTLPAAAATVAGYPSARVSSLLSGWVGADDISERLDFCWLFFLLFNNNGKPVKRSDWSERKSFWIMGIINNRWFVITWVQISLPVCNKWSLFY